MAFCLFTRAGGGGGHDVDLFPFAFIVLFDLAFCLLRGELSICNRFLFVHDVDFFSFCFYCSICSRFLFTTRGGGGHV